MRPMPVAVRVFLVGVFFVGIIGANVVLWRMLRRVNEAKPLSERKDVLDFALRRASTVEIMSEYRRLYPEGRLFPAPFLLVGVGVLCGAAAILL